MPGVVLALLVVLVAFGWTYYLAGCVLVRRQLARGDRAKRPDDWSPPVSILKPLKGAAPELFENLASFCTQDYSDYEILFGVSDANDPAVAAVRRLQEQFPQIPIRLIVAPPLGMNPKSAILDTLVRQAGHDVLVLSDSDIRVRQDYLRRVVQPLRDRQIGLVTCLYTAEPRVNGADRVSAVLDAMHVDLCFLPSVAVASFISDVQFAMGASIALRRQDLLRAGGYPAIADHLADDYMVAQLIAGLGLRLTLADFAVEHRSASESFEALWQRELRWARTLRVLQPRRYACLPATFALLWAGAAVPVSGGAIWTWCLLGATLLVRLMTAWSIAGAIGVVQLRRYLLWLPLRDLIDAIIWLMAWMGDRVTWRGLRYRLRRDGRLAPDTSGPPASLRPMLVRQLDAWLRARQQIFEYTDDPDCIFRICVRRAKRRVRLLDGVAIEPGSEYLELHLWNEHIGAIPHAKGSADLGWAKAAQLRTIRSLRLLARYVQASPQLNSIQGVYGRTVFAARSAEQLKQMVQAFGFEFHGPPAPRLLSRLHDRAEDVLIWMLLRTFGPFDKSTRLRAFPRNEVWMSKRALLERYGGETQTRRRRARRRRIRSVGRDAAEAAGRAPDRPIESGRAAVDPNLRK